jgi:hypothetical protein
MKLVYDSSCELVQAGDVVHIKNRPWTILSVPEDNTDYVTGKTMDEEGWVTLLTPEWLMASWVSDDKWIKMCAEDYGNKAELYIAEEYMK